MSPSQSIIFILKRKAVLLGLLLSNLLQPHLLLLQNNSRCVHTAFIYAQALVLYHVLSIHLTVEQSFAFPLMATLKTMFSFVQFQLLGAWIALQSQEVP